MGDNLRCFSLSTGQELWNFAYDAPGEVMFPGSRSVPAIDGNQIYSCGPYGDLYCIDINTHKPVWRKNVWKDFGGKEIPIWAISQCPLVYGDYLIIASQAPEAGVVAYNKITGEINGKPPILATKPLTIQPGKWFFRFCQDFAKVQPVKRFISSIFIILLYGTG